MSVKVDHSHDTYVRLCDECFNVIPNGMPVFHLFPRFHTAGFRPPYPFDRLDRLDFCGRYCAGIYRDRNLVSIQKDPLNRDG